MRRGDLDEMNASQFEERETEPQTKAAARISLAAELGHEPPQEGRKVVTSFPELGWPSIRAHCPGVLRVS